MNISQAKEQIKNAMTAYFEKDEFGEYLIPEEERRVLIKKFYFFEDKVA